MPIDFHVLSITENEHLQIKKLFINLVDGKASVHATSNHIYNH